MEESSQLNAPEEKFIKEDVQEIQDLSQTNKEEKNPVITQEIPNTLEFCQNQRIAFKRGVQKMEEEPIENSNYYSNDKYSMSSNINKAKSHAFEETKETSDFTSNNKKLRNTMTGLNNDKMKYQSGLIDVILKVEKDNVKHYLKGDLAEMYDDINKTNYFFKNKVFLPNVDNFEKKTGILDKKPIIPYYLNEDISIKLDSYPRTNEIIDKFTERSKKFGFD